MFFYAVIYTAMCAISAGVLAFMRHRHAGRSIKWSLLCGGIAVVFPPVLLVTPLPEDEVLIQLGQLCVYHANTLRSNSKGVRVCPMCAWMAQ